MSKQHDVVKRMGENKQKPPQFQFQLLTWDQEIEKEQTLKWEMEAYSRQANSEQ